MAFGQAAGPPASARRVAELAAVLEALGSDSFREARHPIGLTQRQAPGKFTTGEVDELLERLEPEAEQARGEAPPPAPSPPAVAPRSALAEARAQARRRAADEELVVRVETEVLATELTNRGWCCIPPE